MSLENQGKRSSRRRFLTRTAAASGAFAAASVGRIAPALAGNRKPVYKLAANEPYYHCSPGRKSCEGCKACHKHAKNKLFPNPRAAHHHRAHKGCRCGARETFSLDRETWLKLFG